ncbi:tRNA glutamyl-Q(34) synthetase GluQRS [Planctomycetales bacterium ZRK34]|nr:tRNA glutamyl-Q(34) synthetase GluQRS [Planctomycetales bacterium ZRK34]
MNAFCTRLAPSPTGALHLGNARTFLINWAMARRAGWRIVMRLEDLDGPRIKHDADRAALDTLAWLGLDWDDGPYYQRADLTRYHAALDQLAAAGEIYRCTCTRSQIESAQSAPHADAHELRYPGTCRTPRGTTTKYEADDNDIAWRVHADDATIRFQDDFAGDQSHNVQQTVGDFVVASKAGLPAYQLAVVVDDAAQGVTHIVRGDDLLTSTARQIMLYRKLGLGPEPRYCHLPLVLGPDGRRLAKRHGDTRIGYYRGRSVPPEKIVGLLAEWCGLGHRRPMSAVEFADEFDLNKLPHGPVTFTDDDDAWLQN